MAKETCSVYKKTGEYYTNNYSWNPYELMIKFVAM